MLSIAKLTAARVTYYVEHVGGRDDLQAATAYYTNETPSVSAWRGSAAVHRTGPVQAEHLERLLSGRDPHTGEALIVGRDLKVWAYDLCFSPPKSVSLLWGTASPDVAEVVTAAHDAAVDAALAWLEEEVIVARRGRGGHERVGTGGLTVASVRHLASRAGDPQLHSHCVTSAVVLGEDGKTSAFDSAALYRASKLGGAVYQQSLRHALSEQLGVRWEPTRNAQAELAGIPADLLKEFSQRSQDIAAHQEQLGTASSAKARQAATLETRQPKDEAPEPDLRADWADRLATAGWSADGLLEAAREPRRRPFSHDRTAAKLAGPDGVTAHVAHYGRKEALLAWFDAAPAAWTAAEVVAACDTWLDDQITIRDPETEPGGWSSGRYTCQEILDAEDHVVATARTRMEETATGLCGPEAVDAVVESYGLTEEQEALLRAVCLSGQGLTIGVGVAGAGKSYVLSAVTDVAHAAGYTLIATSTAAKAARELADEAGMDHGRSLAGLLADLERGRTVHVDDAGRRHWQPFALGKDTIVVLDEAAMAETRHVDRLIQAAATAGAKVVMIGDYHQLQAVGAGGTLLDLDALGGVVTLTGTVRANEDWERSAQVRWRNGDPTTVAEYDTHGRIHLHDDADTARRTVLDAWATTLEDEEATSVMLAHRRADVAALNDAARTHLLDTGLLAAKAQVPANECDDDGHVVRSFRLCKDDRVLITRNSDHALNGEQGVVRTTHADGSITIALPSTQGSGVRLVHLPAEELDTGGVALAYALTGHKAQGVTVDHCHVLADGLMTKQWGYSTMTRGRQTNSLTFVADPDREATAEDQLAEAWMRDDLERTARSQLPVTTDAERSEPGFELGRELTLAR